jgi:hypothetical protein
MRTVAVFIGSIIVAFVADLLLGHFFTPDNGRLIVQIFTTDPSSPQWPDIWRQWHHVNMLSLYVITPVVGLFAGAFVGLLQRHRAILVAAGSQVPQFVELYWADRAKIWAHSLSGVLVFLANRSLPFFAAMLAAWLCQCWLNRRTGWGSDVSDTSPPISRGLS